MNHPGTPRLFKETFPIGRGETLLHATAANLLTIDALDPQAKIPEFKACAVQVFPAREEDLPNPDVVLERGRY